MAKGSIEKRGENSWRLRIDLGYNPDGSRNRVSKTITVEDKALLKTTRKLQEYLEDELAKFKQEVLSGEYIKPEKMTFEAFARNEWLPKHAEKNMSPLTVQNYMNHLERVVFPAFGHKQLSEIKPLNIVAIMDGLDKTNMSGNTKLYIFKVIKSVFNQAVKWKLIPKNPMDGLDRPKAEKSKPRYYDQKDAQRAVEALMQEPLMWTVYFLGAMIGGLRRGELNALEWPDIDFEAGGIFVRKSYSVIKNGKPVIKSPKTETSERFVDLPIWYMELLRKYKVQWNEQRLAMGDQWCGGDRQFLFHQGDGQPIYPTTPAHVWYKIMDKHGLPRIRLHDLRHTAATLLIEAGEDLKTIQERLGHTKYTTTADIYAHVTKQMKKRAADHLEKFRPQFVPNSAN